MKTTADGGRRTDEAHCTRNERQAGRISRSSSYVTHAGARRASTLQSAVCRLTDTATQCRLDQSRSMKGRCRRARRCKKTQRHTETDRQTDIRTHCTQVTLRTSDAALYSITHCTSVHCQYTLFIFSSLVVVKVIEMCQFLMLNTTNWTKNGSLASFGVVILFTSTY